MGPPPPLLLLLPLPVEVGDVKADDVDDGELIIADGRDTCGTTLEKSSTVAHYRRIGILHGHAVRCASEGLVVVGPCADNRDDVGHNVEVRCRSPAGDRIKGPSTNSGARTSEWSDGRQWRGWCDADRLARRGDGLDPLSRPRVSSDSGTLVAIRQCDSAQRMTKQPRRSPSEVAEVKGAGRSAGAPWVRKWSEERAGRRKICKYFGRKRRRWPARLLLGPVLEHQGCERRRSARARHTQSSFFAAAESAQREAVCRRSGC